jgi:hypothetical protein
MALGTAAYSVNSAQEDLRRRHARVIEHLEDSASGSRYHRRSALALREMVQAMRQRHPHRSGTPGREPSLEPVLNSAA